MSDYEEDMGDAYDDDEYEFDYDDDEPPEADVDVENEYYNAKNEMENSTEDAITGFRKVLEMQQEEGKWGFKALKQLCKLLFTAGRFEEMQAEYQKLLAYMKNVTRNESEKVINSIIDFVSSSNNFSFLEVLYETTLAALKEQKNDRLWFSIMLKLCRICFEAKDFGKMQRILRDLHKSCEAPDGQEDSKKGTHLQEVYALEIQLCTEQKNHKKLKELYTKSMLIKSAIPHPRIMGVIRECGGKMHMSEKEWEKAHTDFFEAFKHYDEAGHPQRIQCLKYLVLANMLAVSQINPFDSPEAKPYKDNNEIMAMTSLHAAFEDKNIKEVEKILNRNKKSLMDDSFIRLYIEELLRTIRTEVLLMLIKPYTHIKIDHIAKELNIPATDVVGLLVGLILDAKVEGYIDEINQVLQLKDESRSDSRYNSIHKWVGHTSSIYNSLMQKMN